MIAAAPPPWRFQCYVSDDGVDQIRVWYDSASEEVRAKFSSRLRALRQLPLMEWREPLFRWLRGEAHGLGEIRFKADRVQQRPLGFHGPESDVFTLVFPAKEKGDRFVPKNATALALERKAIIERDSRRSIPCWIFGDSAPSISGGIG